MATSNFTALIDAPETLKEPKSVYSRTVEMSDDSMAPIFLKGDLLTIDGDIGEEEGDYVLVRSYGNETVFSIRGNLFAHELHVIRRCTYVGDRANYVPENPAYPEMLEHETLANLECLGPVTSVQRVDGTTQTFDPSTRKKMESWPPVEAVCV
jgi:SOS-response transcriptional repressor LexA